jgi:phosphate transport system substrate-binding protein
MYRALDRLRSLPVVLAASAVMVSSLMVVTPVSVFAANGQCPITVSESGSTTVYPALQNAQTGFQTASGCTLNLVAAGSGAGLTALLGGTVNVAASSRVLNSGNEMNNLYAWQIGGDAMVIAVANDSAMSAVSQITQNQVQGIYSGTITNWNQINAAYPNHTIVARSRITTSGTYSDLLSKFGISASAEAAVVSATGLPRLTTSQDEANAACNNDYQLVYTSLANLQAYGPSGSGCLKALSMAGGSGTNYVAPSVSSVQNGSYPVPRQLFLAVQKFSVIGSTATTDTSANVKAYDLVNYFLSTAGQNSIAAVGFVNQAIPTKPAIPDWDINLDGAIGLADLGNISGRWGQTSSCKGWIRADANNDGAVGLADIGQVTSRWGQVGFVAPN